MIKNLNKSRVIKIVLILLAVVALYQLFSIRFRVDYWLLSNATVHKYDKDTFKDTENNFLALVDEIDAFKEGKQGFFSKYSGVCREKNGGFGLCFGLNDYSYPPAIHEISAEKWGEIAGYEIVFPHDFSLDYISLKKEYPDYVFFRSETSPRFLVYTRGERPQELLSYYWNEHDYVYVEKLADGWYDIVPFG